MGSDDQNFDYKTSAKCVVNTSVSLALRKHLTWFVIIISRSHAIELCKLNRKCSPEQQYSAEF
jgi:hypothetical protein